MPWLAQRVGGHPHYASAGSGLEAVYRRLGYVDVPAPGADEQDEPADTVEPDDAADTAVSSSRDRE
ncbi:hypothetical protein [Amycolatopsis thermophila]|uniref:Uncharacterized protein n=1 Tax=Amycolatopsis thermophila TaxID=206084 RepID=A0ABU0ERP1_9PSEU|nr:hypothetical protein [Amycolatopsis thermophila]MDQ0377953.1 hypothetical protein [Amycolatopsis thermophila]